MKKIKSKKAIIAIVLLGVLAIGGTLAYYTSTSTFDNVFQTAEYKTVATEVFESPNSRDKKVNSDSSRFEVLTAGKRCCFQKRLERQKMRFWSKDFL